jgi:hypothetical protein
VTVADPLNRLGDLRAGGVSGLFLQTPDLRLAWGDRLHEFQEPVDTTQLYEHPKLGRVATSKDIAVPLNAGKHPRWELEIVFCGSPDDDTLKRIIGLVVADEPILDDLVLAYRSKVSKRPIAITDSEALPSLVSLNVRRLDIQVATVWVDEGFRFCVRPVRILWTNDWLLTLWGSPDDTALYTSSYAGPSKGDWESENARSAALPAQRPAHLPSGLPDTVGGLAAVIRFAYFVVGHHEWSVGLIGEVLERWQSRFFEEAGNGQGVNPLDLMTPLSDVGRSIVMMRPALQRLCFVFKSPPFREHAALVTDAYRDADVLRSVGGDVRDAYTVGASAASLYQAFRADHKAAADRRLQRIASVIAALVLWPGFIATLYGAKVTGLPGQGSHRGLLVIALTSVVGSVIILVALLLSLSGREQVSQYKT